MLNLETESESPQNELELNKKNKNKNENENENENKHEHKHKHEQVLPCPDSAPFYNPFSTALYPHLLKVLIMRGTDDSRFKRSPSGARTASEGVGETVFASISSVEKADCTESSATCRDLSTPTHTEARSLQRKASWFVWAEEVRNGTTNGWQKTMCSLCFRDVSTVPVCVRASEREWVDKDDEEEDEDKSLKPLTEAAAAYEGRMSRT